MKKRLLFSLLALVLVSILGARMTESYVRTPLSAGTPIAWNLTAPNTGLVSGGRIVYSLNPAGSDNLPFNQVEQAFAQSFQAWEDIPTCAVAFTRGANSSATTTANDNVLNLFWLESSTTTSDGLNVAGALAVTRLATITSGPATGEIVDGSIVFNGSQYQWTTSGGAGAVDIAEVATHEIGHLIGISHSPIGGTTMFPRSGVGTTRGRSLSVDDRIAASVIYPVGNFLTANGRVTGRVRDGNGNGIFGAHVGVLDANGVATTGAITQPDGSYSIAGLPAGNYQIYAEPLDTVATPYFGKSDLTSFYSNLVTDFEASQDWSFSVGAGQTATVDIPVQRGNPSLDAFIVFDAASNGFLNVGTSVNQGQNNVRVGVAGPGLPQSGTPLSITGPGITIIRHVFVTTNTGLPGILVDINVAANAAPGPRNIVVTGASQRTIVSGGVEVLGGAQPPTAPTVVSAATFQPSVAAESIAAIFGTNLATGTNSAPGGALPTSLGGTTVRLRDAQNNDRLAPLFFVSPGQINYQIAPGIQIGNTTITITSGNGSVSTGTFQVLPVAPGLFSANASGSGPAAANVLRIRNGAQTFESAAGQIDLGPATDQVFLILYGTGFRFRSNLPSCTVGGSAMQVTFAGPQGTLVGLDQANVRLDRSLIGRGVVNVVMTADGRTSNTVTVNIR
ncbi:MAG: matrixin family metalloprotease [Blastocatellia bacterium]|nr:matrixin family metalloprotease [Blastocatellia bacterium]